MAFESRSTRARRDCEGRRVAGASLRAEAFLLRVEEFSNGADMEYAHGSNVSGLDGYDVGDGCCTTIAERRPCCFRSAWRVLRGATTDDGPTSPTVRKIPLLLALHKVSKVEHYMQGQGRCSSTVLPAGGGDIILLPSLHAVTVSVRVMPGFAYLADPRATRIPTIPIITITTNSMGQTLSTMPREQENADGLSVSPKFSSGPGRSESGSVFVSRTCLPS